MKNKFKTTFKQSNIVINHYLVIMKQISLFSWSLIFVLFVVFLVTSGCSNHYVKLGKRCTKVASDSTYEKSFIWIVNKQNIGSFDQKINKDNCLKNGEKL